MAHDFISKKSWDRYKDIVNRFVDNDAGKQVMIWRRRLKWPLLNGEDVRPQYEDVTLDILGQYNFFRTWPVNVPSPSGEKDKISFAVYFTKNQLREVEDALDENDYWQFDEVLDRFIINGHTYVAKGDTQAAQAYEDPLLFQVILEREDNIQKY